MILKSVIDVFVICGAAGHWALRCTEIMRKNESEGISK